MDQHTKHRRRASQGDHKGYEEVLGQRAFPLTAIQSLSPAGQSYLTALVAADQPTLRRMYSTKEGYLCLGPAGIVPGDIVSILATASVRVPLILRRTNDGNYVFMGETYVHGIMDGEYHPEPSEIRNFVIV